MTLYDTYKYIIYDLCDPRAFQYTYLASPWPASIILFAYIYFIKVCGPRFMKDRQPYNIDWLMHLYNLSQLYWNTYLFSYIYDIYKAAQEDKDFSFWCMPVTYSDDNPVSKIIQFILVLIHCFSVFFQPSCYYNTFVTGLAVYQTAGFLYLFLHWYIKAYRLEKKKK
ncbi:Elongation of very long chain fatty acids protein [Gryllus bimaculatus]|nr:Elongation of very long chain fatty acids protein [Gryllus bimaculatus]